MRDSDGLIVDDATIALPGSDRRASAATNGSVTAPPNASAPSSPVPPTRRSGPGGRRWRRCGRGRGRVERHPQVGDPFRRPIEPVVDLAGPVGGALGKGVGPRPHGGALGTQLHRLPGGGLRPGRRPASSISVRHDTASTKRWFMTRTMTPAPASSRRRVAATLRPIRGSRRRAACGRHRRSRRRIRVRPWRWRIAVSSMETASPAATAPACSDHCPSASVIVAPSIGWTPTTAASTCAGRRR